MSSYHACFWLGVVVAALTNLVGLLLYHRFIRKPPDDA